MPEIAQLQITEKCPVDNLPHNFLPWPGNPGWVYCTKCLKTMEVTIEEPPTEPPVDPPIEPPADAVVIHPTGGDDTNLIQQNLNSLASGRALVLSGMFSVGNTIWLDGTEKDLLGDPAKQSGIRPSRTGMNGPYGSMLVPTPGAVRCRIAGLEFDMANKAVQPVFFDNGLDNEISDCFIHDIAVNPSGAPFAAIHSQRVVGLLVLRNRIERTGGIKGGEGVRGIYTPGQSCWIEGNTVKDTGHTGIAAEGANVTIIRNTVERSLVNGTGYKICYRAIYRRLANLGFTLAEARGQATHYFAENTVRDTIGGGIMLQDLGDNTVLIENNQFFNCGEQGTTFGAVYNSTPANNVTVRNNRIENCRSVAGLLRSRNWTFSDNTITGASQVHCENDCHNIRLTRSGTVVVGQNCSEIYVDGVRVA